VIESRFRAFSKITRGNSERTYDALLHRAGSITGYDKNDCKRHFCLFAPAAAALGMEGHWENNLRSKRLNIWIFDFLGRRAPLRGPRRDTRHCFRGVGLLVGVNGVVARRERRIPAGMRVPADGSDAGRCREMHGDEDTARSRRDAVEILEMHTRYCEMHARCRTDAGEVQSRCRRGAEEHLFHRSTGLPPSEPREGRT
jgi:hypothetical protein